jgi:phage terminase large subunit-like protein
LTPPHVRGLRKAAEPSTRDLYAFIERISPRYHAPKHLAPLVRELEAIPAKPKRLIVSVPPRHSKSETLLHFVGMLLSLHPTLRVAYCSYAQTFSETQAIKAHRYARAAGVTPDPKMANRKDWQTPQGGGVFATGVTGEFTGRGADVLIIDDPISNREQADSPTHRDKVWAWFEDVAETRFEPGASVIVLMTRWHEDDLSGRLIKHRPGEYTVIRLPALADGLDALGQAPAADAIGRAEGQALWPERYSRAALEKIRHDKPYTFASLYQGLPRPRGERVFGEPSFYSELPKTYQTVIGVDLAYSRARRANHSSAVVFAVHDSDWFIRRVERWQGDINDSLARLETLRKTYGGPLHVEGNGPQKAIVDLLADKGHQVVSVNRSSDKYAEAQPYAEAWNAGRIHVPDTELLPASWLPAFLEEHRNFTGVNDPEDDQVDAAVNAYKEQPIEIVTGIFGWKGGKQR